ncbi:Methyltransferase FkbM family [Histomonas meleagridis]|uniref:Methyltransferase FkbM family n=1 Tax=Histomonas meleagridis TaxID=135588 RepID=UPI00355AC8B2|nr:Methyltransferase FkbM family [Histomonas meleagridis]KAH0805299.1 Methyltransferase FkbM family [Histomonas meleagridis]
MRAVRECLKVNYTNVEYLPFLKYESITSDEVAKFVMNVFNPKGHILLKGHSTIDIESAVKIALKSANISKCSVHFHNYSHKVSYNSKYNFKKFIGQKDTDVKTLIADAYKGFKLKQNPDKKYYASIVLTGRNDGYGIGFENRAQNFLKAIDYALKVVPLADVEIVLVDYATPVKNKLLSEVLKVPSGLHDKIRFIVVPPSVHTMLEERYQTKYDFLEYVAKNIGIRRLFGKFILTTNADCLFPTEFFELIAAHQFNSAVVYRGNRWDLKPDTLKTHNITMDNLIKIISETWTVSNMDIVQWCTDFDYRFAVIDSCREYKRKAASCAPGDFQMLSKYMWEAVQGFNEVPANPATDSVFIARMMKLMPGYMPMFVHPLFLHQYHNQSYGKRKIFPKEKPAKNDYCCIGNCISCAPFYDRNDWGLINYTFREIMF